MNSYKFSDTNRWATSKDKRLGRSVREQGKYGPEIPSTNTRKGTRGKELCTSRKLKES